MTGTSSPSAQSRASTVPAAEEGTSMEALSVSTSQTMAFSAISSPTFTCHDTIRHDSTLLPSCGMTTTVAMVLSFFFVD